MMYNTVVVVKIVKCINLAVFTLRCNNVEPYSATSGSTAG